VVSAVSVSGMGTWQSAKDFF